MSNTPETAFPPMAVLAPLKMRSIHNLTLLPSPLSIGVHQCSSAVTVPLTPTLTARPPLPPLYALHHQTGPKLDLENPPQSVTIELPESIPKAPPNTRQEHHASYPNNQSPKPTPSPTLNSPTRWPPTRKNCYLVDQLSPTHSKPAFSFSRSTLRHP